MYPKAPETPYVAPPIFYPYRQFLVHRHTGICVQYMTLLLSAPLAIYVVLVLVVFFLFSLFFKC